MSFTEALSALIHLLAQFLEAPALAFMILLVAIVIIVAGSLVVELITERRHFQANHEEIVNRIHEANFTNIESVIEQSALLRRQKNSLNTIVRNMGLPDEELYAMAQVELNRNDLHYLHRLNLTDTISKIAPMLGLMCTLIPLGPGIVAMGQGDVETLSQSLLIAFDATVMGLLAAIFSLIFSRIRKTWYSRYATMMKSLMSCILEEAERARELGVQLPCGSGRSNGGSLSYSPTRQASESTAYAQLGQVSSSTAYAQPGQASSSTAYAQPGQASSSMAYAPASQASSSIPYAPAPQASADYAGTGAMQMNPHGSSVPYPSNVAGGSR